MWPNCEVGITRLVTTRTYNTQNGRSCYSTHVCKQKDLINSLQFSIPILIQIYEKIIKTHVKVRILHTLFISILEAVSDCLGPGTWNSRGYMAKS